MMTFSIDYLAKEAQRRTELLRDVMQRFPHARQVQVGTHSSGTVRTVMVSPGAEEWAERVEAIRVDATEHDDLSPGMYLVPCTTLYLTGVNAGETVTVYSDVFLDVWSGIRRANASDALRAAFTAAVLTAQGGERVK